MFLDTMKMKWVCHDVKGSLHSLIYQVYEVYSKNDLQFSMELLKQAPHVYENDTFTLTQGQNSKLIQDSRLTILLQKSWAMLHSGETRVKKLDLEVFLVELHSEMDVALNALVETPMQPFSAFNIDAKVHTHASSGDFVELVLKTNINRFKNLVRVIDSGVTLLLEVAQGVCEMGHDTNSLMECIKNDRVPEEWKNVAYNSSHSSLRNWLRELSKRLDYVITWQKNHQKGYKAQIVHNVSMLFNPGEFFNGK
jgi:hypothetical protein